MFGNQSKIVDFRRLMVEEKRIKEAIRCQKKAKGEIYLLYASDLGLSLSDFDHKRTFEKFLVNSIIQFVHPKAILSKKESGDPYLENLPEVHLSISHSSDLAVVYFSKEPMVGIDIERLDRTMIGRSKYFLTPLEEAKWKDDNFKLLNAWCAKETMYKCLGGEVESFKNSLVVEEISEDRIVVSHQDVTLVFCVEKLERHLMVYVE